MARCTVRSEWQNSVAALSSHKTACATRQRADWGGVVRGHFKSLRVREQSKHCKEREHPANGIARHLHAST
eukprot:280321-Pleurochrysis_carterae.AAC.1